MSRTTVSQLIHSSWGSKKYLFFIDVYWKDTVKSVLCDFSDYLALTSLRCIDEAGIFYWPFTEKNLRAQESQDTPLKSQSRGKPERGELTGACVYIPGLCSSYFRSPFAGKWPGELSKIRLLGMGCDWVLPPGHTQRSINSHCKIPMLCQQLWVLPAGSRERPNSDLACIQCIGSTFGLQRPEQVLPRGPKSYKCSMPITSFLHPSKEGLCFETVMDHTKKNSDLNPLYAYKKIPVSRYL